MSEKAVVFSSSDDQVTALKQFLQENGFRVVAVERDLEKAIELAEKQKAVLAVFTLDQISQKFRILVETLKRLEERGVRLTSLQEPWVYENFNVAVKALEYSYQKFVKERIRAGIEKAKLRGKKVGRPEKISDQYLLKLLKKYPDLTLRALWKIAKGDGHDISYGWFVYRVNKLKSKIEAR